MSHTDTLSKSELFGTWQLSPKEKEFIMCECSNLCEWKRSEITRISEFDIFYAIRRAFTSLLEIIYFIL